MNTLNFHSDAFACGNVEPANCIIRDVALITSGVTAEGHDLEVDDQTLTQMLSCAQKRGKVPVKLDHGSGIKDMNGFLDNFRLEGKKLIGDWHLLKSDPETPKMLERAQVMPSCFGMSAAFKGEGQLISSGKKAARCFALKSVDCVTSPAANPEGLFSAREPVPTNLERAVKMLEFADPRPRDGMGQYAPQEPGAPDPNSMAAAYGGVMQEKQSRQAVILRAWKNRQLVKPNIEPTRMDGDSMAAISRAVVFLSTPSPDQRKRSLPPALAAGISGAASGAVIGGLSLLKRGTTFRGGFKAIGAGAALAGGVAGGGTLVGSRIIGNPRPDESSGYTTRGTLGGAIVGGAVGLAGAIGARRIPWVRRKAESLAREWRPVAGILKAPLPIAAGGATIGGVVYGAGQGADEGQQIDTLRNLRKDRQRQPARTALFAARQNLLTL